MLRSSDVFVIPFSIMWAGFAFFWEFSVISRGASWFSTLWGIPFVLIGLYLLVGRFIYDAWRRSRIYYGLTEKRVLIATPKSLESLEISGLTDITLKESGDGRGSVIFGRDAGYSRWREESYTWTDAPLIPTFERIAEAGRVYTEIRKLQKKSD